MPPKAQGRMIKKDISNSNGFASLSPEAAVLFAMLIPHFNAHGKMNGGPGYIKDEICPKIPYLTYKNISQLLKEISEKTNVKWFKNDGRHWIHSLNFLTEHQDLRPDRMGPDLLPDYSRNGDGAVPPEVKEEVEGKDKGKGKGKGKGNSGKVPNFTVKDFIAKYCESFKALYGKNPVISPKDSGIATRLVGIPEVELIMERFFKSKDKFIIQNCHAINIIESQINKLLVGDQVKLNGINAWLAKKEKENAEG